MTRFALVAVKDGQERRYGTTGDKAAAEPFRAGLQAVLGVPVQVKELPVEHPAECVNCRPQPADGGDAQ